MRLQVRARSRLWAWGLPQPSQGHFEATEKREKEWKKRKTGNVWTKLTDGKGVSHFDPPLGSSSYLCRTFSALFGQKKLLPPLASFSSIHTECHRRRHAEEPSRRGELTGRRPAQPAASIAADSGYVSLEAGESRPVSPPSPCTLLLGVAPS